MPNGTRMTKEVRKIIKNNRSMYVSLPIEFVRKYGWREHQKLIVEDLGRGRLLIRDWKK